MCYVWGSTGFSVADKNDETIDYSSETDLIEQFQLFTQRKILDQMQPHQMQFTEFLQV